MLSVHWGVGRWGPRSTQSGGHLTVVPPLVSPESCGSAFASYQHPMEDAWVSLATRKRVGPQLQEPRLSPYEMIFFKEQPPWEAQRVKPPHPGELLTLDSQKKK
ncbi:unnamed protein product [Gadus morhua 'NCC']